MTEIIFAALFCFAMVFVLLGALYVLVVLSNSIIRLVAAKPHK